MGDTVPKIHSMLRRIAGSRAFTRQTVYNLYYQFDQGERTETQRRSGPGAPRTQATEENLDKLRDLLIEQDDLTEDEMAEHLKVSHGTVANMISEIGAKKICARWIPHDLNRGNKQTRIDYCEENLRMYHASSDMLDRVIALDESWIRSYDPQDKESAKRWCLPDQPR